MIGGMAADDGDAGRIGVGLVVGRPIDRAALHDTDAQTVADNDGGSPRGGEVGAGSGMPYAELIEPFDRGGNVVGAVIDVVGDTHGVDSGKPQRLAAGL